MSEENSLNFRIMKSSILDVNHDKEFPHIVQILDGDYKNWCISFGEPEIKGFLKKKVKAPWYVSKVPKHVTDQQVSLAYPVLNDIMRHIFENIIKEE